MKTANTSYVTRIVVINDIRFVSTTSYPYLKHYNKYSPNFVVTNLFVRCRNVSVKYRILSIDAQQVIYGGNYLNGPNYKFYLMTCQLNRLV